MDVRLVLPGIPDKKLVFRLTRSYYVPLLRAGVRIYEFTPGFLHAKCYVSDDRAAVVGSINMDYRSLFLTLSAGRCCSITVRSLLCGTMCSAPCRSAGKCSWPTAAPRWPGRCWTVCSAC